MEPKRKRSGQKVVAAKNSNRGNSGLFIFSLPAASFRSRQYSKDNV